MGKPHGAAGGAVMLLTGMAWVPWIVCVALAVLVLLLVFVAALAFCIRGEPTRRVIAFSAVPVGEGPQFATGSPRPQAGEATRPAVVSVLDAANSVGRLPARQTPPPRGWCRSGHRPHPPSWSVATPRTGRPCLITAGARSVPPGPRGRAGKWSCPLGRRRQRRAPAGLRRPGTRSAAR